VLQVPGHRARQHDALQVAALADEVFHLLAMRDAHHVLFDDGTIVEHGGHVVASGADQFDAAVERRVVGTGADEGGQKEWCTLMMREGYCSTNEGGKICM